MNRVLIYLFLFISPSLTAQDSTRLVPVHAWKLSRMIDEVKLGRVCDSTLTSYITALDLSQKTLQASDSLRAEVEVSRDLWKLKNETNEKLIVNNQKQAKIDLRLAKNKGRKVGFVAGIGVLVLVEVGKFVLKR